MGSKTPCVLMESINSCRDSLSIVFLGWKRLGIIQSNLISWTSSDTAGWRSGSIRFLSLPESLSDLFLINLLHYDIRWFKITQGNLATESQRSQRNTRKIIYKESRKTGIFSVGFMVSL